MEVVAEATVVVDLEVEASTVAAGFEEVVSAGLELDMAATMAMDTGILTTAATMTKVVATQFASA
jgi:hypothetical protein